MLDQSTGPRRKIAIVGGGISGLSAAYYLSAHHDVTLFETGARLGGHARTVLAGRNGDQPVDTGFIVFNYATYPHLTRLFQDLNVPVHKSDMSFCASIDDGSYEYGLNSFSSLLAQKSNLLRPQFYRMIRDILYFGKHARQAADSDDISIGELLQKLRLSTAFRDLYLLPMCGAIWSTPIEEIDSFPAKSLVRFFQNHALLAGSEKRQWWTVKGGSIEYVRRLESALRARGCSIHLNAPVNHAQRGDRGVVITSKGAQQNFDEMILACHSDQALEILGDGTSSDERHALSAVRYQTNTAVLHADQTQMPRRRACWSSWAYQSQTGNIGVTYWMNKLQNINEDDPLFLTLNPARPIENTLIYDTVEYAHPVFDRKALIAQKIIHGLQGNNRTWFAGAWNRHGFHEDGIASAMRIVRMMNTPAYTEGKKHATSKQGFETSVPFDLRASA